MSDKKEKRGDEMVGSIEMDNIHGTCKYCGQMKIVQAADEEDANLKVTRSCTCPESRLERKRTQIRNTIMDLCGAGGAQRGFMELTDEQKNAVIMLAEMVESGRAISVSLRMADSAIKLSTDADGNLKFRRDRKETIEEEI